LPADRSWVESCRLWLVTDNKAAAPRTIDEAAQLALAGGVDAVVCRVKDAPEPARRALIADVLIVCRNAGQPSIVSHEVDLALELGAAGVHVAESGLTLTSLRSRVGEQRTIGVSTHSVAAAQTALEQGADYVFLGPIYPTPGKLRYGPPLGLTAVQQASRLPGTVVFIGGIGESNLAEVAAHGARRVAVIRALQAVADPQQAALRLKAELI
jgi:thiamine-phosphate pyrophosphorylase